MVTVTKNLTSLVSITIIGGIVGKGLSYILLILIARSLGAGALGAFTFGLVVLKLGAMIARFGLDNSVKKFIPLYRRDELPDQVSGVILGALGATTLVGFLIGSALYFSMESIGNFITLEIAESTRFFVLGIPLFALMTVGVEATKGFIETKYAVYAKDIVQSGSAIVLAGIVIYIGGDVDGVIFAYVASLGLGALAAVWFLARQGAFEWEERPRFEYRRVFSFSATVMLVATIQYFLTWTDILMLSFFEESSVVGTYQAVFQTAALLGFLLYAVNSVFSPIISDLYHGGEHERLQQLYAAATKWITYPTVFGFCFLLFYTETVLLVFGTEFEDGQVALVILGVTYVINAMVGPAGYLLTMSEYERIEFVNAAVLGLLNIGLNYVLIQQYGLLGAAIATGLSLSLLNIIRVAEIWWLLNLRPTPERYWKGALAIGSSVSIMYLGQGLPLSDVPSALVVAPLSFGVFTLMLYLLGTDPNDKLLVESLE